MPFPKCTTEWAEEVRSIIFSSASGTASTGDEKKRVVKDLFHGIHFKYGFEESLATGDWTPWPKSRGYKMANCYGQAIANFAAAQACGLDPFLVEFVGLQKEGETHRAGHSNVFIDVGDEGNSELWTLDQALGMYGPVTLEANAMSVVNLGAKQGRTVRNDFQERTYGFIWTIVNGEEAIAANMQSLQATPEAVLYPGQRVGIPCLDGWQSEEPLETPWYIKFIPTRNGAGKGTLVSRLMFDRPGIKKRGLEYRMALRDGGVAEEQVLGYYCDRMIWSDFVNPHTLLTLSRERASALCTRLAELSSEEQRSFEMDLMQQSAAPSQGYQVYVEAAQESFEQLCASEDGEIVLAFAAAEALFQHDEGARLPRERRERAIAKLKHIDPLFAYHAGVTKDKEKLAKTRKKIERVPEKQLQSFLAQSQREDPRTEAFLQLDTVQERLEHIAKSRPRFLDDAVNRLLFYERRIKGNEGQIREMAQERFGATVEEALFRGYVRIFAELLGHCSFALPELCLDKYRESIIAKLTKD